jgi:predicted CxxxxCH...CXXCH cytochrome family protein
MCHGGVNDASGAPPKTTWGNSGDPVRVGAHQRHVALYDCGLCHLKPADALSPGHLDGATATVKFGALAAQGTSPAWNRSAATCSGTYCHGGTLTGGTHREPVWTLLDGTQRTCDSCHGAPPANAYHTRSDLDCATCHGAGYSATSAAAATHVDGTIQFTVTCTSCHGDPAASGTAAAAPPRGTHGETGTTTRAVGAHQRHLLGGTMTKPIPCAECHTVPTSMLHANGTVLVAFGPLATARSATPSWSAASSTCSSTWCHGGKLTGGTLTAPVWTRVDGTQATCGGCHGRPPTSGRHGQSEHRVSCGYCHGGSYSTTAVDKALHVNGVIEMSGPRIRSWNPSTLQCTPTCHGSETWGSGGWR